LEFNVPFQHKYGYIRDETLFSVFSRLAPYWHGLATISQHKTTELTKS